MDSVVAEKIMIYETPSINYQERYKMHKRLYITTILIGLLFYLPGIANSAVRTIYFVPNDRVPQNHIHSTINTQMKAVQVFYKAQMNAHGYGNRTFALETDHTGKVITHTIIGNHRDSHYIKDTLTKVETEVNNRFNIKTDIYIIFVDISNNRVNGSCGIARFEGGPVLIPTHGGWVTGQEGGGLIAHELGHAFNLIHDFRSESYIMSYGANRTEISKCAADYLNVSPYFNGRRNANDQSPTIEMVTPETYPKNAPDWTLEFDITDPDGLYQVQFELAVPGEPASLFDCVAVQNVDTQTRVTFQMPDGATISPINNIWIRVADVHGNVQTQEWTLTATEDTTPVTVIETTGRTLLTLEYDAHNTLTPTNPKVEWQTWGQLWEKTPDGLVPRTPNGLFPADTFGGDNWKHFFYAHADSRIVWDISNKDYENFHAHFDMPNPCGNYAKLTVVFMADDTEIYNSGVLQGSEGRHSEITFDIPEGTEMLTLKVDDLGDPGCDHFVFGEPTLTHSVTTESPVTTTPTTTTPTTMGNTTVSLLPISVQSPNIGQLLKLSVKITNGKNVAGYQATVQFDDTALRYVESSNSDYLPDGAFFVSPILEGNLVRLNAASLAGESNGDGTLATLTFEVIAVKASILTLSAVLVSSSTGETFAPQVENSQITEPTKLIGDVNSDGTVNIADLVLVASNLGQIGQNAADVNSDGVVNIADLVLVASALGTSAAPSIHPYALEMLIATDVKQWLSAAQQLNLTDMKSQRGVLFLQQLLITLTPKETAFLPNFPNPFNPETWIPYHLAKDADVTLYIYTINGELVRTLTFEHQSAGKYQNRSRAAYWDGKNAFGEPVASGLYFYTLTAGDFTATRKMLIAK